MEVFSSEQAYDGAGALSWYEKEYEELDILQREIGRWIWGCKMYVKNKLVRGETGWSSFKEKAAKAKIKWFVRLLVGENIVSEIGRACLLEVGLKFRWWKRVNHLCEKAELFELSNVICLGD